ncbi:N-acetyltransferase [Candidatus Bathyarchaeota archaeon]|nr:MAG: N-acetyltransferase [Candidatus Bathyarchaeota archaeon]
MPEGNSNKDGAKKSWSFLVAESQGETVGTVIGFIPYLPPSLLLETRIGYIGHLALHPDLQGRGIGSSS